MDIGSVFKNAVMENKNIIKRTLENFWIKIKHIISGNIYNIINYNSDLYVKRSNICKKCDKKKKVAGVNYCGICGCPIRTLTRVKDEKCLMNKWNE